MDCPMLNFPYLLQVQLKIQLAKDSESYHLDFKDSSDHDFFSDVAEFLDYWISIGLLISITCKTININPTDCF